MKKVVCFGEILWDILPEGEKIGGAPLNVALRLNAFDNNSVSIISAVGQDKHGDKLVSYLQQNNLSTNSIQIKSSVETGKVIVQVDHDGIASYNIRYPAAWDYISFETNDGAMVSEADVFIFGSLIAREQQSRNTLFKLLKNAAYKVFDVNLRPPHFTLDLLKSLMKQADFIKFNDEEILHITSLMGRQYKTVEEAMEFISKSFNTDSICVTRGDKGALLMINNTLYYHNGYQVTVKDTIGAGDSFLATLIHYLTDGNAPEKALDFACAIGALVASHDGANPKLSKSEISTFMAGQ